MVENKSPLAARLRPINFDTFIGQTHLIGPDKPLRIAIEQSNLHSMILWGPPGSGKTTLAEIIANISHHPFIQMSAVLAGVKEIREAIAQSQEKKAILFIDEIHRFNKAQQDALLPFVEKGVVFLIGATTENPSFSVNHALLSRCRVYQLKSLTQEELLEILDNALKDKKNGLGSLHLDISIESKQRLLMASDGDARRLLNIVEILGEAARTLNKPRKITPQLIDKVLHQDYRWFDKQGDIFYEQISALHKAVRGSSPDGALYWLARMLDGGCDPLYIARRALRMASEDIGNADPRALSLALDAWQTVERLGSPEGELALAQIIVYLACAPKSNAIYNAFNQVLEQVKKQPSYPVPIHLRNAPTKLMKNIGYGKAYRYDHAEPNAFAIGQTYFPDELGELRYYHPVQRGLEIKIAEKMAHLRMLNEKSN